MSSKNIFQANQVYVVVASVVRFILFITFAILAFTFDTLATMCTSLKKVFERK